MTSELRAPSTIADHPMGEASPGEINVSLPEDFVPVFSDRR